jgi:hypothetical protein
MISPSPVVSKRRSGWLAQKLANSSSVMGAAVSVAGSSASSMAKAMVRL